MISNFERDFPDLSEENYGKEKPKPIVSERTRLLTAPLGAFGRKNARIDKKIDFDPADRMPKIELESKREQGGRMRKKQKAIPKLLSKKRKPNVL